MTDPTPTLRALAKAFIERYPVPTEHLLLEFVVQVQALQREADAQIAETCKPIHAEGFRADVLRLPYQHEIAAAIRESASDPPRAATSNGQGGTQAEEYDAGDEWTKLLNGALPSDRPLAAREKAMAFLRIWANSYLKNGNYWDVPQTMGNALSQVIRILEADRK